MGLALLCRVSSCIYEPLWGAVFIEKNERQVSAALSNCLFMAWARLIGIRPPATLALSSFTVTKASMERRYHSIGPCSARTVQLFCIQCSTPCVQRVAPCILRATHCIPRAAPSIHSRAVGHSIYSTTHPSPPARGMLRMA